MIENGDALVVRDAGPAELRGGTITNPAAFVVETRIIGDVRAIITLSALEAKTGKAAHAYAFQCAAAPEMLGVLREWIRLVDGGSMDIESAQIHLDRLHTLARAAIAKATGVRP